ncbi:nuclear factor kappaB, partial [Triplophysa rosa]
VIWGWIPMDLNPPMPRTVHALPRSPNSSPMGGSRPTHSRLTQVRDEDEISVAASEGDLLASAGQAQDEADVSIGLQSVSSSYCMKKDGEHCLKLLVEAGAKINMPEQKSGYTALHLAVRDNLLKVACNLITELKADVNGCTYGGNSPLHLAASQGSPHFCSMLIAAEHKEILQPYQQRRGERRKEKRGGVWTGSPAFIWEPPAHWHSHRVCARALETKDQEPAPRRCAFPPGREEGTVLLQLLRSKNKHLQFDSPGVSSTR